MWGAAPRTSRIAAAFLLFVGTVSAATASARVIGNASTPKPNDRTIARKLPPQVWAVEINAGNVWLLTDANARRLRHGVNTLLFSSNLDAGQIAKAKAFAKRYRFHSLTLPAMASGQKTWQSVVPNCAERPSELCVGTAAANDAASALRETPGLDVVVVRQSGPIAPDELRSTASASGRVLVLVSVSGKSSIDRRTWRAAIRKAALTPNLDIAVAPRAPHAQRALTGYTSVLSTMDVTPPTVPTEVTLKSATQTSLGISWRASRDDRRLAGYDVYRGQTLVSSSRKTSASLTSLGCGTTYQLGVDAYDAVGNRSAQATLQVSTSPCSSASAPSDTTPPTQPFGLTVSSSTQTSLSLSWVGSTDATGVTGYGLYLNDVAYGESPASPATFSGLACGRTYRLAVDAYDPAGNRSARTAIDASTSPCLTSDTNAPSSPTNLRKTGATETSISVAWSSSNDNIGVAGYGMYRAGAFVGSTAATSYTFEGLSCNTNYTVAVDAYDAAGNRSFKLPLTASTGACPASDTTVPTTPSPFTIKSTTATSISFEWGGSTDNVGVVGYGVYRGGTRMATTPYTTYTLTGLSCGTSYVVGADAYDAAGNRSTVVSATAQTGSCDSSAPSAPSGVTVSGQSATSLTLSWAASSDNIAVAGYGRYNGSSLVSSGTGTSFTFTGLTCGTPYTLGVDAYDAAGNRSARTQVNGSTTSCADTVPPAAPSSLAVGAKTATSLTLTWTAPSDNVGVTGYGYYLNAALLANGAGTSYTFTGLACATSYTLGVDAYDAAGNRSGRAQLTASTNACPDTQAPTTPSGLVVSAQTANSLTLAWTDSTDNVGVTGYGRYLNGSLLSSAAGTSFTFSGLACGSSYTLGVDAYDANGNRSTRAQTIASTTACLDTQAPTTPSGLAVSTQTTTSLTLGWAASTDNTGVAGYGRYLNGSLLSSGAGQSFTFSGLACGTSYTFGVDSYDAAGNRSARAQLTASTSACAPAPDTQAPTVPDNQRITATTQSSVAMAWDASTDNVGVTGYNVFLNGLKVTNTASTTWTYTGLACGTTYTVALEAQDAAGNVSNRLLASGSASTAACAPTGDTQAPTTPTALSPSNVTGTTLTVSWTASTDNVGVAGYGVYRSGALAGTSASTSYSISGLTCGTSYPIAVDSYDGAGNRSAKASINVTTAACTTPAPPPPPPPSGSAALYLSPSGSDSAGCTQAAPCRNLKRAYDLAAPGATVELAGGSYGSQSISGSKAAPRVVFRPASGASVSLGSTSISADNLELRDMAVSDWVSQADSDGFIARNLDVNFFQIYGSSNISVLGGDVGPSYTPGGNSIVNYITYGANGTVKPTNVLIEGVYFHDFRRGSDADHMECIMVVGGDGITFRGNRFVRCDIFNIFFTQWAGPEPPKNVLVENNFFNRTTTDGQPGGTSLSLQFSGHMVRMENFTVRNNSLAMPLGIDSSPVNVRVIGNAMPWSGCVSGVSYGYNVMQDSMSFPCNSTDKIVSGTRYESDRLGFANAAGGDLHLTSGSPAINAGSPSDFPSADFDGQTRPLGGRADAGADEAG
jgi:chitodextrinase